MSGLDKLSQKEKLNRLMVGQYFTLSPEAKRFLLALLENHSKPFNEICEIAGTTATGGWRIMHSAPFKRTLRFIVEPVVMMHLGNLLQAVIDDAMTPSGRRAREMLMRFSGLVDGGTSFDAAGLQDTSELQEAIPDAVSHEVLDADPVAAEVLSMLEQALQTNMGRFCAGSQRRALQGSESLVLPDEGLESTSPETDAEPE